MNHSHYQYANPDYTPQPQRPSGKRTWESSQASWIPSGPQHPSAPNYSNQQPQHQSHFAPVVPESSSNEDDHYSRSTKRIKVDHHHVPPQSFVSTVEPAHVSLRSTPVEQNAPEHYQPMNAFLGQLHQQRRKKHRNVNDHSHQETPQLHSGNSFSSSSSTVSIAHDPHHTHRRLPSTTTAAEQAPASHQSVSSSSHAETPGRTLASMAHNLHSLSMDPPPPSSHYRRPYSVKLFSNSKLA